MDSKYYLLKCTCRRISELNLLFSKHKKRWTLNKKKIKAAHLIIHSDRNYNKRRNTFTTMSLTWRICSKQERKTLFVSWGELESFCCYHKYPAKIGRWNYFKICFNSWFCYNRTWVVTLIGIEVFIQILLAVSFILFLFKHFW